MVERSPSLPVSLLRGGRLTLHLLYAALLAIAYPHLSPDRQRRILKEWSRQLLDILDIGIRIENIGGHTGGWQHARDMGSCLIVANHVLWLDVFVLNALYPARFIAKAEVRDWPFIGWLCERGGTIFIERAMRLNVAQVNRHISFLLKQGICVGLFPEGTTTDGRQVWHFRSSLIQPAIDAGAMLCPIALRYQGGDGKQSDAAAFVGDMTLPRSVWRILRNPRFDALLALTPVLATAGESRRVLARTAQEAIAQELQNITAIRQAPEQETAPAIPQTLLSAQSAYAPLFLPLSNQPPK